MADLKYYDVILRPVVTEKTMEDIAIKRYTFYVHPEANKAQIKEAVEKMFEGTKVASVNTMNLEGKNRRRGMVFGKTAKRKKAIVTLTEESKDIEIISNMALNINKYMVEFFASVGVELIDFKLEFGKTADGEIVLADEISPDTCRFWDIKTHEKLDKDRFRRDLGNVEEAYAEMMKRIGLAK